MDKRSSFSLAAITAMFLLVQVFGPILRSAIADDQGIPQANFWSFTLYDNMTRSMLDTPQRYPRAGSQSFPSPAAEPNADGSTSVYFSPQQPDGIARGNWIQTMPDKGFFVILRLYSPLEPFFTKEWRPSEIEVVK